MFEINGELRTFELSPGRFTQTLDAIMEVQLRQAARQWLRAVIVNVPIWTGMSMGTLKPLGAYLRVKVPNGPIVKKDHPQRSFDKGAAYGEFEFSKSGATYTFHFDESLPSFVINEYYNVSPPLHLKNPGPWNALKAGEFAFLNYVDNELPKHLPKIEDITVVKSTEIY